MSLISEQVRSFWDIDAATYDRLPSHNPTSAVELAAWGATLRRLLPPPPARVLDIGAGTGFLAIQLARQRYEITALDLSAAMLAHLADKARDAGLEVKTVQGDAAKASVEGFEVVVERHLLWTLPDPERALEAWHKAAEWLVLLESLRGPEAGTSERLRRAGRSALHRIRREQPEHHAEYSAELRAQLPLATGPHRRPWCAWWAPRRGARPGSRGCGTSSGPLREAFPQGSTACSGYHPATPLSPGNRLA